MTDKQQNHRWNANRRMRSGSWAVCAALCAFQNAWALAGEGAFVERYFDQLRKRRLFSVAEQLGADRLASPRLSPAARIQTSVELSETYADHARFTSGEEHAIYWQLAESVLDEGLAKYSEHPRSLLLRVQRAFVPAARGKFLGGQTEVFPHDADLRRQTAAVFQTAIDRLEAADQELGRRVRKLSSSGVRAPDDLALFELNALVGETRFRRAETLQEFAKIQGPYSANRSKLLSDAYKLWDVLSESRSADGFQKQAEIRLAENYRLRNNLRGAEAILEETGSEALSAEVKDEWMAERVRWLMAGQQIAQADEELTAYRKNANRPSGELAFLHVQVLLTLWKTSKKTGRDSAAADLLDRIQKQIESGPTKVDGYWTYRIARLEEELQKARKYGVDIADIVTTAESVYAAGQIDDALQHYQQAALQARNDGRSEIAFELGYTAGSILIRQERFADAAEQFRELAETFPKNNRAASAKLLEAVCRGRIYAANPTQSHREAYTAALNALLAAYPRHETTGDAYWMLGQHEEERRQVTQALTHYRKIPHDHRRGLSGQLAVARCYEKVLARLADLAASADDAQKLAIQEKTREWENAATTELSRIIDDYPPEPEPLSAGQADVVLRLAKMQLTRTTPAYQNADSLLERVLAGGAHYSPPPNSPAPQAAAWSRILKSARQLRIVSLAGQGLSRQAQKRVEQLKDSSTEDVLAVLDGLMQVADAANIGAEEGLAKIQLQTALELNRRRSELSNDEKSRLDHCRAQAYLATDQADAALKIYETMLSQNPKSPALRQKIARILSDSANDTALLKAKSLWRTLEARHKPGTLTWLEHRYELASTCQKLGQSEECLKLIGVTRLLYPSLGNEELAAKYDRLEKSVKQ